MNRLFNTDLPAEEEKYASQFGSISRPFSRAFELTARPFSTIRQETTTRPTLQAIFDMIYAKGVDISVWQGDINWDLLASLIDFVFIRAGYGNNYVDPKLEQNLIGAADRGVPYGLYWFLTPDKSWQKHAESFANIVKQYGCQTRIIFDKEVTGGLGKTALESWYSKCMMETEQLVGFPVDKDCKDGSYTSPGFLNGAIALTNWLKYRHLWVAHWTNLEEPLRPNEWLKPNFPWEWWQHAVLPNGLEYGVQSKKLDHVRFNGTVAQMRSRFNLGETPPTPPEFPIPPVFPPPEEDENVILMRVIQDGLRVRSLPNFSAPILSTLSSGSILKAKSIHGNDAWIEYYDPDLEKDVYCNVKQNADRNMESL